MTDVTPSAIAPHELGRIADDIADAVRARLDVPALSSAALIAQLRAQRDMYLEDQLTWTAAAGVATQNVLPASSQSFLMTGLLVIVPTGSTTFQVQVGDKVMNPPAPVFSLHGLSWQLRQADPRKITVGGAAGPCIYIGWGYELPIAGF